MTIETADKPTEVWTDLFENFQGNTVTIACSCGWQSRTYRRTDNPEIHDEQEYVEDAHLQGHITEGKTVRHRFDG
jgi:hypothetical protein